MALVQPLCTQGESLVNHLPINVMEGIAIDVKRVAARWVVVAKAASVKVLLCESDIVHEEHIVGRSYRPAVAKAIDQLDVALYQIGRLSVLQMLASSVDRVRRYHGVDFRVIAEDPSLALGA